MFARLEHTGLVLEPAMAFEAARRTTPEFLREVLNSVDDPDQVSARMRTHIENAR